MYQYHVYLIVSINKLVILNYKKDDSDYRELMNNNGTRGDILLNICNMFCIGYIQGTIMNKAVVNSMEEFT